LHFFVENEFNFFVLI